MSKKALLTQFRKEYNEACTKDVAEGDCHHTDAVVDKFMNMETEEFDADDLNEIIDDVQDERQFNTPQTFGKDHPPSDVKTIKHFIFLIEGREPITIEEDSLQDAKDTMYNKMDIDLDEEVWQAVEIDICGSVENVAWIK